MLKTVVLLIELVLTIVSFLLILNMTTYAMYSYKQAQDTAYQTVYQFQQDADNVYGNVPTDQMPDASRNILSNLLNFRI